MCIILSALSSYRQTNTMTYTTVATDIHQSFDVELDYRAGFAFHFDTVIGDRTADRTHLVVGPVLYFDVVVNTSTFEDLAGRAASYTIILGQPYLAPFVFW